jgi:hypothetical protein
LFFPQSSTLFPLTSGPACLLLQQEYNYVKSLPSLLKLEFYLAHFNKRAKSLDLFCRSHIYANELTPSVVVVTGYSLPQIVLYVGRLLRVYNKEVAQMLHVGPACLLVGYLVDGYGHAQVRYRGTKGSPLPGTSLVSIQVLFKL